MSKFAFRLPLKVRYPEVLVGLFIYFPRNTNGFCLFRKGVNNATGN